MSKSGKNLDTGCHLCGSKDFIVLKRITLKPEGETDYGIAPQDYYREICLCNNCRVYFNRHNNLIPDGFYEGHYNASIKMGDLDRRFNKIISLPFHSSDNKNRVLRIVNYLYQNDYNPSKMNVLDVGAGTSVFLHEMKKFGFQTFCIDPDPSSTKHAIESVHVNDAYTGTLETFDSVQKFDLITFNKVLEHIINPVSALKLARKFLSNEGIIYVELPDGSPSIEKDEIENRSEFFLEHYTTFNKPAFEFLVNSSGYTMLKLEQITDPSGKFTILGFLRQ